MCRSCRQQCRGIRFDFQCKKFYHDYCLSSSYTPPDMIYFFNPSFERPGFREFDTWPQTIKAAIQTTAPIVVTSTTQDESLSDLVRLEKLADYEIEIIQPPQVNAYASTRPDRNFSPETDVISFKNKFLFIARGSS